MPHKTQELNSPSERVLLRHPTTHLQRYLHHRPPIRLPGRNHIIQRTHRRNRPRDQNRPIHRRRLDLLIRGPKAEKEHKQQIRTGKRVVRNPQYPRDFPRPPDGVDAGAGGSLGGERSEGGGGGGGGDGAGAAAVEQQGGGEQVGGEEARDGDGDDAVEGGGGAEVDEGEEGGDDAGEGDGVDGDGGSWAELWDLSTIERFLREE